MATNALTPVIGNRYQLHEQLGEGGMGTVYRATDRLYRRAIAFKRTRHSAPEEWMALAREFQVLATMHHPNVVPVIDYGIDEEQSPFFTMTLIENARNLLDAGMEADPVGKLQLLIQLLEALAYLHRRDVTHRDLKPGNVLVTSGGQVKVLDFGLALEEGKADLFRFAGSQHYMAPEVRLMQPATPAVDLYAVGVLAFQLFAGRHPFDISDRRRLHHETIHDAPDLSPLPDTLDDALAGEAVVPFSEIVGRLLRKRPHNRYPDAEAVIHDLSALIGQPVRETIVVRESFLQTARFVGREDELTRLGTALTAAIAGQGSVWLVGGESGVGKSRLLEEMKILALVEKALVIRGQTIEGSSTLYQLWRRPVRQLVLIAEPDDTDAAILQPLIPDIGQLLGRDIPPVPELRGEAGHRRLVTTIVRLFRQLQTPVLLILEDLHWGEASLDVIKMLTGAAGQLPLLVIGSYRDNERSDLPALLPGAQTLKLEPLDDAAIAELSESMLGAGGKEQPVIDLLRHETEGNPFLLVEIVRALAEDAGGLHDVGQMTLPDKITTRGIERLLRERLDHVPQEARPLLQLAAIIGQTLDLEVMGAVAAEANIEDWLILCSNLAVLHWHEDHWHFVHHDLCQTVREQLTDAERSALHRRVAEAIETVYPGDETQALALAEHWHQAGDRDIAVSCARIAVEQLLATGHYAEALRLGERTLTLLADSDTETEMTFLKFHGDAYEGLSDYHQARTSYERSLEMARRQNDLHGITAALIGLGWIDWQEGHYAAAENSLIEGLESARDCGSKVNQARALRDLGMVADAHGNFASAQNLFQESLPLARDVGDQRGIASCLNNLGLIAKDQREYDAALAYYEDSLAISREIRDQRLLSHTLENLGVLTELQGDYQAAEKYFNDSLSLSRETGEQHAISDVLCNLAFVGLKQHDIAQARQHLNEALPIAWEIAAHPITLETLVGFAWLRLLDNQPQSAAELLGLVMAHPATSAELIRDRVDPLLINIERTLSSEELKASLGQGKGLELEPVVAGLLAEATQ